MDIILHANLFKLKRMEKFCNFPVQQQLHRGKKLTKILRDGKNCEDFTIKKLNGMEIE